MPFSAENLTVDVLEAHAGEILRLLKARTAKRPLIIELAGSPKAGKTTAIGVLSLFFRRNGFKVETLTERASVSPINSKKGHPDFNVWVSCASLLGIIESLEKDIDLFIVDRGIFDALIWNTHLARTGKTSAQEAHTIAAFFTLDRWIRLVDLVCVMKCAPAQSIEREYANQLTKKRGAIMTEENLERLNNAIDETFASYSSRFKKVFMIDTSHTNPKEGATEIARETLAALRGFLDESLCVLHRSKLPFELPGKGFVFSEEIIQKLANAIASHSEFIPRSQAECDSNYLIPIPCALVLFRNRILILKRNEKGHPLHNTYSIWVGGHVMQSDDDAKNILLQCLRRELSEELYIRNECTLTPVGIVRTDPDERASRHIGIVYTAKLSDDRVALALDQKEFRETKGTSVSGRLIEVSVLQRYFERMGDWSKFIVASMWPTQATAGGPREPGSRARD